MYVSSNLSIKKKIQLLYNGLDKRDWSTVWLHFSHCIVTLFHQRNAWHLLQSHWSLEYFRWHPMRFVRFSSNFSNYIRSSISKAWDRKSFQWQISTWNIEHIKSSWKQQTCQMTIHSIIGLFIMPSLLLTHFITQ